MREMLFLRPVLKEAIWGGCRLGNEYGYPIPSEHTGEAWVISAHPSGDCVVVGGRFEGMCLSELWQNHREIFGCLEGDRFPLLTKIIDAAQDLSIQVHPDDDYAFVHEQGASGKTECWYILDCASDATIVIGHHAKDKAELARMVQEKRWGELIREVPIRPGDFFQIEPGCLHAIRAGTLLLETQQNSDITYRVYDYDRIMDGKPRQLHLEQSLAVLTAPFAEADVVSAVTDMESLRITHLVRCPYYVVEKLEVFGTSVWNSRAPFLCLSVIDGMGQLDGVKIEKGDHFILPAGYGEVGLEGRMTLIVSAVSG